MTIFLNINCDILQANVDLFSYFIMYCLFCLQRNCLFPTTYETLMPPPSWSRVPLGAYDTVWSLASNEHSTRTVLSVSCIMTGFCWITTWLTYRPRPYVHKTPQQDSYKIRFLNILLKKILATGFIKQLKNTSTLGASE